ncbi:hypothetical protein M0805_009721 [Coniferiporia weirii]|nr:hypothetical protein M0805_009721 [Coniferiporia weirii]
MGRSTLPPPRQTTVRSAPAQEPVETVADTAALTNAEWAQYHLTRLATASSTREYKAREATAFARQANITVNGLHLSRDLYALQWGAAYAAGGSVAFAGTVETPQVPMPALQNAALVGLLYDATFANSDVRRGAEPVTLFNISVSSSANLIIAEDKSLPSFIRDRRRIFTVNQVIADKDGDLIFPLRNA